MCSASGFCITANFISENSIHVVTGSATDATAVLDGFTIKAGNASGFGFPGNRGAGMFNNAGSPTVANCTFTRNAATGDGGAGDTSRGGGMHNTAGSNPMITNCTFRGNAAQGGGGMFNQSNSNPLVIGCTFDENSGNGGGMNNDSSTPTLTGCTFSANFAPTLGGGMSNDSASPSLNGCVFIGNTSGGAGGGMWNRNSSPVLNDCTFTANATGSRGGAIKNENGSSPVLINCTFTNNSAILDPVNGGGGAIYDDDGNCPTVTGCTFVGNSTSGSGGAYFTQCAAVMFVTNSTFLGNSAQFGGGAFFGNFGGPRLINCVFSGNSATTGGAVHTFLGSGTEPTNCTFVGNTATTNGGGYYNSGAIPLIRNCVFWGNVDDSDGDAGGPFFDESAQIHVAGGAPVVNYSVVQGGWSGLDQRGVLDVDPLFVDADGPDNIPGTLDDDVRLHPASPAIDAGNTTALPFDDFDLDGDGDFAELLPIDLAGHPRVRDDDHTIDTGVSGIGGVVDMGAFELYSDCNNNGVLDADEITLGLLLDCNDNWIPDVCEIDENSVAPGGPFLCIVSCDPDCNGNGIPDSCDIAACGVDVPFDASCDDCNLNGVPDGCDDPIDSIPDECVATIVDPLATDDWSDALNWPLGGDFPDNDPANPVGAANLSITLDNAVDLRVNVNIAVNTLRLLDGTVLRVTQTGAAGDFTTALPGGIQSAGTIFVDNDRVVDVSAGTFTLRDKGRFVADPSGNLSRNSSGTGTLTASLIAGSVELLHDSDPAGRLEQLTLTDGMSLTSLGAFVMDGTGSCDCPLNNSPECVPPLGAGAALRGGRTPPITRVIDAAPAIAGVKNGSSIRIEGDFVIECAVELCIGCEDGPDGPIATVELLGNFVNQCVVPSTFEWLNGRLLLSGLNTRTFETGGIDFGMSLEGFNTEADALHDTLTHKNFAMGTIELATGASVEFVNRELNTVGSEACQEALYIDELIMGDDTTVTATDTRVYYTKLTQGTNATIAPPSGCGAVCLILNAPETDAVPKNRFLSILGSNPGRQTAIRVTLVDLPIPFDLWNGQTLWVGEPSEVSEGGAVIPPDPDFPTFQAARLRCDGPVFRDWSATGPVQVFHEAIVPGASFQIQEIDDGCPNPNEVRNFSLATEITTPIWGDTLLDLSESPPPPPEGDVKIVDALGVLGRFSGVPGSLVKARADLEPACVDLKVNVSDVLSSLAGFVGLSYPFVPTAADPCDSTCPNPLP